VGVARPGARTFRKGEDVRPCDCRDMLTAQTQLSEQGIAFNDDSIQVEPNVVYITVGPARLRMPMPLFKKFAEWYLADQEPPDKSK